MAIQVGKVSFYAGPSQVGAPDDLEKVIVDFINGAQKRLEVAVQELESRPIAEALIAARKRKVLVKLVIEQDYLRSKNKQKEPWKSNPKSSNEHNRLVHDALLRTNIDVKCDYNTSIFHQKFIIRDRKALLTGSTNFTPTGTASNLNHIVVIHDENVARIYAREFREIQKGHFGKLNEGHDPAPMDTTVSNVPIRVLFAPDHNPEMEIMKQMLKAKKRVDFAIFTFSESSGIDDTMFKLLDLNMPIRGAYDDAQHKNKEWAAIKPLKQKGAKLYGVKKGNGINKLHHKLMVLDDQVVVAGSFNYTGPANRVNDENILILGDLETQSADRKQAQKKIALYARKEIDRIINQHG